MMVLKDIPADNITRPLGRNEVIGLLFRLTIFGAVTYFTIKWMVDAIDPTRKQKVEAQKQVNPKLLTCDHFFYLFIFVCVLLIRHDHLKFEIFLYLEQVESVQFDITVCKLQLQ